ncbi:MAG: hypothetical protein ACXW4Z_16070 [Candidatus Binatia bacterium]
MKEKPNRASKMGGTQTWSKIEQLKMEVPDDKQQQTTESIAEWLPNNGGREFLRMVGGN